MASFSGVYALPVYRIKTASVIFIWGLFTLFGLGGCASQLSRLKSGSCPQDGTIACTKQGAIQGVAEGNTLAFKGVPYAKPPIGDLRYRAPVAPDPWQGVRNGSQFGPMCPQLRGTEVVGSEDCLTLNIWRPVTQPNAPLPVMIFLTGGGNHSYSGQGSPIFGGVHFNGEKLAPEGVIFVSFNIRLGALGFLAHPALTEENSNHVSGNYGSLDQIAMLRWVHDNISAFGGDPSRVFLFGTSAGGGNICALMTSPMARGLFHGASMQSSVPTGCEIQTLADAQNGTGRLVVEKLGCADTPDIAACLRNKSVTETVKAVPGTFGVLPRVYGPNMDGKIFPEQPLSAIIHHRYMLMPVIIGNAAGETIRFVDIVGPINDGATYEAAIAKVFGKSNVERILNEYPLASYHDPHQAFVQLTTDAQFTCQSRKVARALASAQEEPVYQYLFMHSLENDPVQKALGPTHTVEHPFFFPWQGEYRPTASDLEVQQFVVKKWTELAKTGKLSGTNPIAWPQILAGNDALLEIGPHLKITSSALINHCDFWDTITMPWPHL